MAWERRRYRGGKVWVDVDPQGAPVLDARGLAAMRYRPDDERTYSVRPQEIGPLAAPRPPETAEPGTPVLCHARGAASGNPGPAGVGVVLRWGERRREIRLALQAATGDEASLTAVLTALRAVRRPTLPVRVRTDSGYVIGVLEGEGRPAAHRRLVQRIRRAMRRFPDLRFVKVPPDGGEPEDLRALALAHEAARAGGSAGGPAGGPPSKGRRYHGDE